MADILSILGRVHRLAAEIAHGTAFPNTAAAEIERIALEGVLHLQRQEPLPALRVVIEIEDGMMANVSADGLCDVVVIDHDTDGGNPADLVAIPAQDGDDKPVRAYFRYPEAAASHERAAAWVAAVHALDPDAGDA